MQRYGHGHRSENSYTTLSSKAPFILITALGQPANVALTDSAYRGRHGTNSALFIGLLWCRSQEINFCIMHKLPVNTVVPVNLSVSNANWVRYALGAVLRLNTVVMHCRIIWFTLARPTHFALAVTPSMANYFLFGHGHKAARTRGDVKTLTRLSLAYCDGGSYVSAVSMVAAFIVPAAV